jgi:integrase/recombinase XerD
MTTALATDTNAAPLATTGAPHPVSAYLSRLRSEHSRRSMTTNLRAAARILSNGRPLDPWAVPWQNLEPAHVAALASALVSEGAKLDGEPYGARSANAVMAAVRGVLRECWRAGLIDAETRERCSDVRPEATPTEDHGRHLAAGERDALYRSAASDDNAARGARDAALLAVLDGGGLRRAEAVALGVADVDLDGESVMVRKGKGRKERRVPLASGSAAIIREWLAVRGDHPGPLLTPIRKGGAVLLRALTTRAVARILERLAAAAGVEAFRAHDFRRTMIGDLLEAGADISTVQRLAGHASPDTTARYDRRPAEVQRKAARLRSVPNYRRRAPDRSPGRLVEKEAHPALGEGAGARAAPSQADG